MPKMIPLARSSYAAPALPVARFIASGLAFKLGAALLILVVIAVASALSMRQFVDRHDRSYATISTAFRLKILCQKLAPDILTGSGDPAAESIRIETATNEFETGLNELGQEFQADGVPLNQGASAQAFHAMRRQWSAYRDALLALQADAQSESQRADLNVRADRLRRSLDTIIFTAAAAARIHENNTQSLVGWLFYAHLFCLLCALLFVRARILKPLREFTKIAEQFGAGAHHVRIANPACDELGQFAQAFNGMADRLEGEIAQSADETHHLQALWCDSKKLSYAIEHSSVCVIIANHEGVIEFVNARFTEVTGYAPEEVIGQNARTFRSGQTPEDVQRDLWQTISSGKVWVGDILNRKKNGELFWESTRVTPLRNERAEITHFVSLKVDVTAYKEAIMNLRLRQRAVEASSNGVALIDAQMHPHAIIYINPAFTRITGLCEDEALGRDVSSILCFDDVANLQAQPLVPLWHREDHTWVTQVARKDRERFWCETALTSVKDDKDRVTHYVVTLSDVTERIDYEQRLAYQATHDTLTGLANRALLADRISQAISQSNRSTHLAAIVLIDLDHFKYVNDTMGHAIGDSLLQMVAGRLSGCAREIDTVARMGGDEFVVILTQLTDASEAECALQRIVEAIALPYRIESETVHVSCSAGACFYPRDGECADKLLRNADTAMYEAKNSGRNNFQFYQPVMNARLSHRVSMEAQLRQALEREEFLLHYQPQIDLRSGAIAGVEALVRWQHPELGLVGPGNFIQLAEETGLIVPIGAWVLRAACSQAQTWKQAGLPDIRIAVNLSAHQLKLKTLGSLIEDVLIKTGLSPANLELEITESVVVQDTEPVIRLLGDLRSRGLRIALDDFGTGYSSLSYLKRLPIDVLKIDQSFVRGIDTDRNDAALTRTVIELAQTLDLHTIAEGVETASQAALLRTWGCNEAQGFLFHRPLPAEELSGLLRVTG